MGTPDPQYNSSWDGSQIYVNGKTESSTVFSGLCNEPFWDYDLSWDTQDPEFSSCLESTAVVWLPCGLFLLHCPFYFYVLKRRPYNPIPWTALSYAKLALSFIIIAAAIAELSWVAIIGLKIYSVAELLAPILLLITYTLHIALVCLGRLRGERTSWSLWLFWLLMILCGIPQVVSSIKSLMYPRNVNPPVLAVLYILQYIVTIALFITNWFADAPSKLQLLMMTKKPNPELSASFPSRMMLWWCFPLVWTGWKRPIVFDDLWDVKPDFSANVLTKHWHEDFATKPKYSKESFNTGKANKGKKVYLYRRMWRMSRSYLAFLIFMYGLAEMLRFVPPQLLSLLINFITNTDEPVWHGYLYAVSLLLACEFTSVVKNNYFYNAVNLSIKIRSALMSAIYHKALKLSGSARRESTLGQIVNMMAVDAQIVGDTTWQILSIIFAPVIILVSMAFLWEKLGPSVLSGLAILVLLTPVNSYLANKTKKCQFEAIKLRDKRVKMSSEIVGGIKVLKLYAWEESFAKQIQAVRDEEVSYFRKIAFLQAFQGFIFNVSPYMVSLATFTTYLLISSDNILDAEMAFVSIALFNIMKIPITQMPSVVAQIIQASVALKRLKAFLAGDELDPLAVCSDRSEKADLLISNGQFSWEGADGLPSWTFRDVNLRITHGKLVAVVGPVGAGKSSLISALLGEIKKDSGKVVVNGSLAYVSQQAWLQNATLRDNITWGLPFDEKWYNKVIHACALQPDLDMLEGGDMTEVGEKGINLSGGQKQRISLARAVYRDADIILLDDPLSAVDAHVGKHIFENVIGPSGLLKSKTRLLVTHAVTFLPQVDEVVVVKDGRLVENGTYNDLVAADGDFAQFVFQYVTSCDDESVDEGILGLRDNLEGATRGEVLRQLSQISSTGSHSTVPNQLGKHNSLKHLEKQDNGRQRSISESQGEIKPNHHFIINKQLNHSNRSLSMIHNDKVLHKQISNGSAGGIRSSMNGSIYGSNISINSSVGREQLMSMEMSPPEEPEEKDKTHMIVNEELQETGKVARYVYLVYGRAMGALYAITPIVSLSLGQGCVAGGNVWLSFWSSSGNTDDNVIFVNSTLEPLPAEDSGQVSREAFLTGYGAFGIGQAVFIFGGQVFILLGCLRAANFLHSSLLQSVIRLPMSFFDTNPSGRIINRFSKEMSSLDFNLPNIMRSLLSCFTQVVATLMVIVISTPIAAVALIPIMIIYYLMQVVYVATSRQIKRIESVSKSPIYTHFSESLQGVSVIRAFRKQDEFIQESLSKIDRFIKAVTFNVSANRWVAIHLETLGNIITFAAAMLGVLGRETISPGVVGLSVTYALNITLVLNWLVRIASDLEAHIVSVERINEYIQKKQEAAWLIEEKQPIASWPENGSISFNHYETRYRPGLELVLKGITCTFRPSEKVGIVGRTGAGKSSLTLALFRLIESAGGNINIDGTNIADIGLHDLRSRLSIIPQDPVLFSGTLRMNLDPFEKHTDDNIWDSLELAHLKEYIKSQPLGLLHPVDEEGANFSVGQRQLICLARALLRHSKILVLDEATAAVDLETDDLIQATIRDQFKECTVLTIAHRINTILDCDRVLVLSQGRIAEFDTPGALLADSHSIFHGMAVDAGLI